MICPKCLAPKALKMWVDVTVECSGDQQKLDKTSIRKKEVQIIAVDWPNARYYCSKCDYYEEV
jgi:hypothetical protein